MLITNWFDGLCLLLGVAGLPLAIYLAWLDDWNLDIFEEADDEL